MVKKKIKSDKRVGDMLGYFVDLLLDGQTDTVKEMLTTANVKLSDHVGCGVVWHICYYQTNDDTDLLRHALSLGAPLVQCGSGYWSALHNVTRKNQPKKARMLIDFGMDPNITIRNETPLQWTCNKLCMKVLLDAGANPTRPKGSIEIQTWIYDFLESRQQKREVAIAVLGLKQCESHIIGRFNGVNVLQLIARCIWATRGIFE